MTKKWIHISDLYCVYSGIFVNQLQLPADPDGNVSQVRKTEKAAIYDTLHFLTGGKCGETESHIKQAALGIHHYLYDKMPFLEEIEFNFVSYPSYPNEPEFDVMNMMSWEKAKCEALEEMISLYGEWHEVAAIEDYQPQEAVEDNFLKHLSIDTSVQNYALNFKTGQNDITVYKKVLIDSRELVEVQQDLNLTSLKNSVLILN